MVRAIIQFAYSNDNKLENPRIQLTIDAIDLIASLFASQLDVRFSVTQTGHDSGKTSDKLYC